MHELAIAKTLIESATALIPNNEGRISRLRVQLGQLAGLSEDELRFGFEVMARDTACADAVLQVDHLPAIVHCPACGRDGGIVDNAALLCAYCGSPAVIVVQGKELLITSLDVETPTEPGIAEEVAHG